MSSGETSILQHHAEAETAYQQGDFQKAAEEFAAARMEYTQIKEDSLAAEMSSNQSVALLFAGYPEMALETAQQAGSFFAHSGETQKYAIALGNQAAALEALGQKADAETLYSQSARLLEENGDRSDAASALKKMSSIHFSYFHIGKALIFYRKALELSDHHSIVDKIFLKLIKRTPVA